MYAHRSRSVFSSPASPPQAHPVLTKLRPGAPRRSAPRVPSRVAAAFLALAAFAGAATPALAAGEAIAYQNPFLEPAGAEWNPARTMNAPSGEQFLGPFRNERTVLSVADMPQHDLMVVAFDLYVRGDWQGDAAGALPPSILSVKIDGQDTVVNASIATERQGASRTQSFPDEVGQRAHEPGFGSFQTDSLLFTDITGKPQSDTTYRVVIAMRHSGTNVTVDIGVDGLIDPSAHWGVDNVAIEVSSMEDWPEMSIVGPTTLEGFGNPFGQGSVGQNPPKPGLPPPGSVDDSGDPNDPPPPPENPPVPAPGAAVMALLGSLAAARRRRRS